MPHERYFCDIPLTKGDLCHLEESEWHHLAHVSRAEIGDHVEIVNGKGALAQAKVHALNKKSATLFIEEVHQEPPSKPDLVLALALPKKSHLDWVIEKGTELNATHFWLFPGLRSDKRGANEQQLQRFKILSISAMKQCGRLDLPSIELKPPLLEWKPIEGSLYFGDVHEKAPYLFQLPKPIALPVVLFIGPERGFAPSEEEHLRQVLKAKGVSFHPNVLRAETAPLVALSLIQTLL